MAILNKNTSIRDIEDVYKYLLTWFNLIQFN